MKATCHYLRRPQVLWCSRLLFHSVSTKLTFVPIYGGCLHLVKPFSCYTVPLSITLVTHQLRHQYCSLDYLKLLFGGFRRSKPSLSYYFSTHLTLNFSDFEWQLLQRFSLSNLTTLSFTGFIFMV